MQGQLSRSPTTATSWTTSPAGFSRSITAARIRSKATTALGSSTATLGLSRSSVSPTPGPARWHRNWSGCACRRGPGKRRAGHASARTRNCWRRIARLLTSSAEQMRCRSRSRCHVASARRSSRPKVLSRPTAKSCCSTILHSVCRLAASSGWSARTVPARPRCSGCWSATSSPMRAASPSARRSTLRTWTSHVRCWTPTARSTKRSPVGTTRCASLAWTVPARSTAGPSSHRSTSPAQINRSAWATSQAASATGCTWRGR